MAERLLSNVYQLNAHPLDGAAYLIYDAKNQEHTLIDCGSTLGYLGLERQLAHEFAIEMGRIAIVHATHGHFDHVAAKTHMPQSLLHIHEADRIAVEEADPKRTAMILYPNVIFPPGISNIETISEGYETRIGGTTIYAIETPGHTPGGICYKVVTDEGIILVGGDTLEGCFNQEFGSDIDAWSNSLDKLAENEFNYVTYGHTLTGLMPDAMAYLDRARSRFGVLVPSHEGGAFYPWARTEATPRRIGSAQQSMRRYI